MSADEYAMHYPAHPPALRTIARGLRRLGAVGDGTRPACPLCGNPRDPANRDGQGNQVFTLCQDQLAEVLEVSVRTLQRYLPLFESYGILELKRWRYRQIGGSPSSYRVFLGNVIPEDWTYGGGNYPVSAVERRRKDT
jgi:hypothetical protein